MSENFAEQYRFSKFGLYENEHELIHMEFTIHTETYLFMPRSGWFQGPKQARLSTQPFQCPK